MPRFGITSCSCARPPRRRSQTLSPWIKSDGSRLRRRRSRRLRQHWRRRRRAGRRLRGLQVRRRPRPSSKSEFGRPRKLEGWVRPRQSAVITERAMTTTAVMMVMRTTGVALHECARAVRPNATRTVRSCRHRPRSKPLQLRRRRHSFLSAWWRH